MEGQTENLNCEGVCFRSQESFALGEVLEIRLHLSEILGASHGYSEMVCLARVVQTESDDPAAPFRYGCRIEDYTVEPARVGAAGAVHTAVPVTAAP